MVKAFFRDSAIYVIPTILSRGLALFLIPLYTRVLSPADYGALDLLTVFGNLVNLTIALEVSQGVARFYGIERATQRKAGYASTALWFTVVTYITFLVVALIYGSELSALIMGKAGLELYFRIGVVYIGVNGIFLLVQNQFRWELRSKNYAIVSILVTLVTAGLAVTMAYFLKWGLAGLLLGMIGGSLIGSVYGLWHLRNTFYFKFHWTQLKDMLKFSAPLVPSGIAVFINNYTDRLMINHYLSLDAVGIYGVAFRLAGVVSLVVWGFQGALTPLVYAHYQEPETPRHLAQIFRFFTVFATLIFLFLSLFARELLSLITTPAYYPAAQLIIFLVPAILFSTMYIFAPGIAIAKKTYVILWVNVLGAASNILFCWLLIPLYGIIGAAVATLMSYVFTFFVFMFYSQKYYYIPHSWKRSVLALSIAALLAYGIPRLPVSFGLGIGVKVVGLFFYVVIILAIGLVQIVELQGLYEAARMKLVNVLKKGN